MNTTTMPPVAEMTKAYQQNDASYNGLFFVAVRTTGIFCRPACPARKAMAAGYRPCKRCRPLETDEQPKWATTLLADIERDPSARISDSDLKARGIDPATVRPHFLRPDRVTFQ